MDENPYQSPAVSEAPRARSRIRWFLALVGYLFAIGIGAGGSVALILGQWGVFWAILATGLVGLVATLVFVYVSARARLQLSDDPAHRVGRALRKANRELSRIRPNPDRALEALAPYRDECAFDGITLSTECLTGQLRGPVWAVIGDAYREAGEWSLARDWYRRTGDQTEFCCGAEPFADMVVLQKMEREYPAALGYLRRYDLVVAATSSVDWFHWYIRRACSLDWLSPKYWRFVRRTRMVRATLEEHERNLIAQAHPSA